MQVRIAPTVIRLRIERPNDSFVSRKTHPFEPNASGKSERERLRLMGLRTNHCPPIFTRLLSHATRFAILGSPVPLRQLILGKRVDYVS